MASARAQDVSKKPCRACVDFKTWVKSQGQETKNPEDSTTSKQRSDCPADSEQLGQATWTFLHTMAAYYPDSPSENQQKDMTCLIGNLSKFYPCDYCADHMREWVQKNPPKTDTRKDLSQWMCVMHNDVNKRLGKTIFDCNKADERWLTGWKDGSCN